MANNTPEVRFEGFSGEWEGRNLSEVVDVKSGRDYKHLNTGDIPVYGTGGKMLCVDDALSFEEDAIGIGRKGTIDKPYILKAPFWTVDTLFYCIPKENFELNFVYGIYQRINWKIKDESTGVPSLSKTVINNTLINTPFLNEQTKLGSFFKQLDNRISLQQQELDTLKQTKQGFLQKMFPKEGETVPEVRFPGFSGDWGVENAKEIFNSISDKNHPKLPVLSASQEKGMVYRNSIGIDIKYDENSTKTYKKVLPGQFVIHLRSFQGGFAFSNFEGITSPAYTVIDFKNKELNDSLFWKNIFTSNTFIKRLETVTYGIRDGKSISFTDFSTLKFKRPSNEEQAQIGLFFKQLDDTIALQQQELDAMKETKKAFLQKMFV